MAGKRITDVDFIESLNSDESFFINQNSTIKQIKRSDVVFNINNGGTGATNAADARANLGITPENIGAVTMMAVSAELLPDSAWVDNKQIVNVDGVTNDNVVIANPDPSVDNYKAYTECAVRCIAQSSGKLTFVCDYVPDTSIIVNILMLV